MRSDEPEPLEGDLTPKEKEYMRYHYYIHHGIDTVHVSPLDDLVLNRVMTHLMFVRKRTLQKCLQLF